MGLIKPLIYSLSWLQWFLLPGTALLGLIFLWLSIVRKDKAAGLVLVLGVIIIVDEYMMIGIKMPGLEHGSIRYSELILLFLIFRRQNRIWKIVQNPLRSRVLILWAIYLLLFLISVLRSLNPTGEFLVSFRKIGITSFMLFWFASSGFTEEKDYLRVLKYFMVLAILLSIVSYQQIFFDKFFLKSPVLEKELFYRSMNHGRFGSFFGNPNMMASFCVLAIPSLLILCLKAEKRWSQISYYGAILTVTFSFFKTYSRGAFLGFSCMAFPYLFLKVKDIHVGKKIGLSLLAVVCILIFAPNIFDSVFKRIGTIESEETIQTSRLQLWQNTSVIVKDNLLFGIGYGDYTFGRNAIRYIRQSKIKSIRGMDSIDHPHNSYLLIAVMMGCPALIVFITMMFTILKNMAKQLNRHVSSDLSIVGFGFFCGVFGFLVTSIFDYHFFTRGAASVFWVVCGLLVSLYPRLPRVNETEG